MEPVRRTSASSVPDDDIQDLQEALASIELQAVWERSERDLHAVRHVGQNRTFSLANDNNARAAPRAPQRDDDEQDPDLELLGPIDAHCFAIYDRVIAYFKENSWCIDLPSDVTGNTPLHSAVRLFTKKPKFQDRLTVYIAALLELGASKQAANHEGITPMQAAFATDNKLITHLFVADRPVRSLELIELAEKCGQEGLKRLLSMPDFRLLFEAQSGKFVKKLKKDPTNAYAKLLQFYAGFPEIAEYKNPETGDTTLHDAVQNYLNGQPFGILEVVILIQMGASLHIKNKEGTSAKEFALQGGNTIIKELVALEKPTIDDVYSIVFNNPDIDTTLYMWLTQVE